MVWVCSKSRQPNFDAREKALQVGRRFSFWSGPSGQVGMKRGVDFGPKCLELRENSWLRPKYEAMYEIPFLYSVQYLGR